MTDNNSSSNNTESVAKAAPTPPPTPQKASKPVLEAGDTGSFMSLISFLQATGQTEALKEIEESRVTEDTEEVGTLIEEPLTGDDDGKEDDSPDETEKSSEEGDGDEESSEEELQVDEADKEEKDEEAPKGSEKFLTGYSNGKEIKIPDDLIIPWKVDGEITEINLKDHLNVVAGELTVNQRLGKIASFREELQKNVKIAEQREQEFTTKVNKLVELAASDKPENALYYLAELSGKSPVQMYRSLLAQSTKAADAFEGWSEHQIENHFLKLESEYQKNKKIKEEAESKKKRSVDDFLANANAIVKKNNLSEDEFIDAVDTLAEEHEGWKGLSPNERRDLAVTHALDVKHASMVAQAIDGIDSKLRANSKFVQLVLKQTDPRDWTVEDIKKLISRVLGVEQKRIASTLSKKGAPPAQSSKKKNEVKAENRKAFSSVADMARAFGLRY